MKKINFKSKLNTKQRIILGVTSIALVTIGFYGFNVISKEKERQRIEASLVELYQVPGREKVFMNGILVPVKSEKLSVNAEQGEISEIKVQDNSYVEKGTPLFTCKNSPQVKEIELLKSQVTTKTKEKSNALDEESKLIINEEIKQLNNQINELNKSAYSTVYAPFSGKVYINENDDKSYVMVLETLELYVRGQVNERDSYKISLDQNVEIKAIATNNNYTGKITEIGDRPYEGQDSSQGNGADYGMTKYEVKMSLNSQENLKNGLNVQIIAFSGMTYKKIPNVSVLEENNKYYVYKVENEIAHKIEIKVKEKKDDYYLVENGVKESDEIIKDIQVREIKDGEQIYTGKNQ